MEEVIRVFVADPSRDYLDLLCDALAQQPDFTVVGTAVSGDRAAEAIPRCRVDLLITDLLLPGLDGLSLLRKLKDAGCLNHAIVVSGFYNDYVARAASVLADNYIPKPCRTEDLIRHMRDTVHGNGRAFVHSYDSVVTQLLIDFGILPHLDGFAYLRNSILCTLEDHSLLRGVTKSLYRDTAKRFDTTPACVERSIRAAIERAWERRSDAERRRRFGTLFDDFSKAPSNVPFLTAMTEFIESQYEKDPRPPR